MRDSQRRKELAWRKNRKFGDVHGGRTQPKVADGVFNRAHSLQRPSPHDELPILIEDNPSRDFHFPLCGEETVRAIKALPSTDVDSITHVWLRKCRKADYEAGRVWLAQFICGSGVRVVILYPWPNDRTMWLGKERPGNRLLKEYERWSPEIVRRDGIWRFRFEEKALRSLCIENLIYHEVGHHVDWYRRHWTGPNRRRAEEFANQYAMSHSATATEVIDALDGLDGPDEGEGR